MFWVNFGFVVVLYFVLRLAYMLGKDQTFSKERGLSDEEKFGIILREYQDEILRLHEEVLKLKLKEVNHDR